MLLLQLDPVPNAPMHLLCSSSHGIDCIAPLHVHFKRQHNSTTVAILSECPTATSLETVSTAADLIPYCGPVLPMHANLAGKPLLNDMPRSSYWC